MVAGLTEPQAHAIPASTWAPQPAIYSEGSDLNLSVQASDGTVLRADVYYPTDAATGEAAPGPFPVLLQQTPYGKESIAEGGALAGTDVSYLVDRGCIVVISDVRGTGTSGGTFGLFDPVQGTDGATVVEWAARLPHADGKVGLFGESYMGINQFLTVGAAGSGSPIKAMFPIIAGHDIYSDTVTQGGIPDVEFSSFYLFLLASLNAGSPALEPLAEAAATGSLSAFTAALSSLPPTEIAHNQALISYDLTTLENLETGGSEAYDGAYWAARSPSSYLADVVADNIPAFLVGGWNDLLQQGEPLNYAALQNLYGKRPAAAPMDAGQTVTSRYQLMMGPLQHVTTGTGVNMPAIELEWFDTWLLGQDTPLAHTTTPLHLYQLESGQWLDSSTWPAAGAPATAYYFGAGRSGNDSVSTNDGTPTPAQPSASSGSDPVLWSPQSTPCDVQTDQWAAGIPALAASSLGTTDPCDTNDVALGAGPDALTYTPAPFASPEVLAGPIDASVAATATTSDVELAATVEEVSSTGQSVPLTSGALLGSLRALDPAQSRTGSDGRLLLPGHPFSETLAQPVVPGQVTRYDIAVFPTFAAIPAGWRLRVTLTTADTPHLEPSAAQTPHLVGGVYQVERNAAAASYLNVALVPPSAFSAPCGALCSAGGR